VNDAQDLAFACVIALAWFGAINLAASAAVSAVAWRLERRDHAAGLATSAAVLFALKLLPGLVSVFFTLAVFVPAQWRFEPEGAEEEAGVCLSMLAAVGLVTIVLAVQRGLRDARRTSRIEREWQGRATTGEIAGGLPVPVFCLPDAAPILSLAGIWKPRLFVARPVLEAFSPDELDVSVAHERAHLDARDNLKRLAMSCSPDLLALWRPGRHLAGRWRAAAEFDADARAARGSEERAVTLAAALLKIVRLAPRPVVAAPGVGFYDGTVLWARIDRLLAPRAVEAPAGHLAPAWSVGLGVAGVATALLTAEAVWLSVHLLTEGLIRTLP